jgi:hypothetical protein
MLASRVIHRPNTQAQSAAIFGHECPEARRVAILAASTRTLGRPSRFPFDLAAAIPDFTRSRISSRSNSAMLAKMPNTRRPFGVLVSTPSCNEMTRSRASGTLRTHSQVPQTPGKTVIAIDHDSIDESLRADSEKCIELRPVPWSRWFRHPRTRRQSPSRGAYSIRVVLEAAFPGLVRGALKLAHK